MENIKIYDMNLNDFDEIKDILISDFDDFWEPSVLKNEILGENKKYIVAKKENKIVGFAGLMFVFDEVEIMNVVTKKSERGNGIGKFLLNKMIEIAKNKDKEKIFLEVNQKNEIAVKMYEKAGFIKVSKRKNYYYGKEDAIIMSKNVNIL